MTHSPRPGPLNNEEQRILTNTSKQLAHAIHALYKEPPTSRASKPFVAAEQVIMCQGIMVLEWCSTRCQGRSGSCRSCSRCSVNVLTVGSDCTLRARQVLPDVPGGTVP
jgi:hypothetical protein